MPKGGSVCFDGQDLAGLDSMSVRKQIGVVLQSGVVNSGSLFDNIAGESRLAPDYIVKRLRRIIGPIYDEQ